MLSWERMLVSAIRDAEREGSLKPQASRDFLRFLSPSFADLLSLSILPQRYHARMGRHFGGE